MVKIRLLDDPDVPVEEEAFLTLERHKDGFAVVLVDSDGDQIVQPYILFLEPGVDGKLKLSLASSPSDDFVEKNHLLNQIAISPSY